MLLLGDCNDWLKEIKDNSIDLIVSDPPYGIEFMSRDWDRAVVPTATWKECYRVLKEGKLAFVMCSPRQDVLSRMIINLQDAGFRTNYTSIYWTYASGFPKAANVGKLLDKRNGRTDDESKAVSIYLKQKRIEKGLSVDDINKTLNSIAICQHYETLNDNNHRLPTQQNYQKLKTLLDLDDRFDELIARIEAEREIIGDKIYGDGKTYPQTGKRKCFNQLHSENYHKLTKPATEAAKKMEGAYVGFQPKPAVEVILVVSKGKTLTWLDDVRIPYQNEDDIFKNHTASGWNQFAMDTDVSETVSIRANPPPDPEEFAAYLKERRLAKGLSMREIDDKLGTNTAYSWWEGRAAGIQLPSTPEYYLKLKEILDLDDRYDKQMTEFVEVERKGLKDIEKQPNEKGRFPANLLVSDDCLNDGKSWRGAIDNHKASSIYGNEMKDKAKGWGKEEFGSYSRYFSLDAWADKTFPFIITPKASRQERNKGLDSLEPIKVNDGRNTPIDNPFQRGETLRSNSHPTVKPLKLMSYLITMGSREGDLVLDPFCGSGTVCIAADQLHRKWIGIEKNEEYAAIIKKRLMVPLSQLKLTVFE